MARIIMIARATGKIAAVTARLPAAGIKPQPRRHWPGLKLCESQSIAILPQGGAEGKRGIKVRIRQFAVNASGSHHPCRP